MKTVVGVVSVWVVSRERQQSWRFPENMHDVAVKPAVVLPPPTYNTIKSLPRCVRFVGIRMYFYIDVGGSVMVYRETAFKYDSCKSNIKKEYYGNNKIACFRICKLQNEHHQLLIVNEDVRCMCYVRRAGRFGRVIDEYFVSIHVFSILLHKLLLIVTFGHCFIFV